MRKEELRKIYKQKRASLSLEEVKNKSLEITQNLLAFIRESGHKALHTYLSISKNKEVNTSFLIQKLRQEFPALKLLVPKTDFAQKTMQIFELDQNTQVEKNNLGIPEPKNAKLFRQTNDIGVVLVPLLVADRRGYRVGYGGGFYDIFLASLPKNIHKIGLSFFSPILKIEDIEIHDIPLDYLAMPQKIVKF